jgi:predicted RNase H-like HicB family nuclease
MQQTYTAVIQQSGSWWIGWIEEVPGVNCQEHTREDLLETPSITLKEGLDLNRREPLEAAGEVFEETPVAVWSGRRCCAISGGTGVSSCVKGAVTRGGKIRTHRRRSAVPRHSEIDDNLARRICKGLGVPRIK